MSYNIAVAQSPVPIDSQEAWEWVQNMTDIDDDAPPQVFHELIERLTARYPCIYDLGDDVLGEEGVWSDGPLLKNIYMKVPVLGIVSTQVDEVLPFLIETAKVLNLSVFDWATETIHRPKSIA